MTLNQLREVRDKLRIRISRMMRVHSCLPACDPEFKNVHRRLRYAMRYYNALVYLDRKLILEVGNYDGKGNRSTPGQQRKAKAGK
jgi:hypothetical protein